MRCSKCGYEFVLDPKVFRLSDRRMLRTLDQVTEGRTRWWTPNQAAAALARKRGGLWRWSYTTEKSFRRDHSAVLRFTIDRPIAGMIATPALVTGAPADWPEPDLSDYGAERILVVDDRLAVDLLVRNWVHSNARAIVLAVDGYPEPALVLARRLVEGRPDVPIAVLHSSNAVVGPMVNATRELLDIPTTTYIVDLGLPADAWKRVKPLYRLRYLSSIPVDSLPHRILADGLVRSLTEGGTIERAVTAARANTSDADEDGRFDWLIASWLDDVGDFG